MRGNSSCAQTSLVVDRSHQLENMYIGMDIMRVKRFYLSLAAVPLAVSLTIGASTVVAEENWSDRISFSGFANANYHITNDTAPFNGEKGQGHDDKGSFQGTSAGLNFRADISERFNFAAQFFGSEEDENFNVDLQWAFATLKLTDDVDFRAGKAKMPAGLVNEYVNVGYALPWINAPAVIYSELPLPGGPQVTREAYTGVALVGNHNTGDWTFGANLFGGDIDLESGQLRQMRGLTLNADWNDLVQLQATYYKGEMSNIATMPIMNGEDNDTWLIGAKADWNNVVVYAEMAKVEMGSINAADRDSWYTTVGYRFGKLLPFINYESFERGNTDEQTTATAGVRWDFMPSVALKAEVSRIDTDKGLGLFASGTPGDEVMMYGLGLSTVF